MNLGRYKVLEELGRGSFGIVYKAEDQALDRVVALKVLHNQLTVDPGFIGRFEQEAKLAARLDHPNLVPIYDLGQIDGLFFIAMGLMAGGSLKDRLKKEGAFGSEKARDVFSQILQGVQVIHENNIIHRDLKPGNILFDQYGIARISDLGFAKALHSDASTSLSMSGGMIGTPAYMAPEIWEGKPAGPASDIYSLGCVLYEILTGEVLFDGESAAEVMTKHIIHGPKLETRALPLFWKNILGQCLAQKAQNRYLSVREFLDDLKNNKSITVAAENSSEPLPEETASPGEGGLIEERKECQPVDHKEAGSDLNASGGKTIAEEDMLMSEPQISDDLKLNSKTSESKSRVDLSAIIDAPLRPEEGKKSGRIDKPWLFPLLIFLGLVMIAIIPSLVDSFSPVEPTQTPRPTQTPQPTQAPQQIRTTIREIDGMEMVYVPAGEFSMGSESGDIDEKPVHTVYLDAYWIDKYEVSNGQYAKCVAAGDCTKPSYTKSYTRSNYYGNPEYDNYPVIYVNWNQAKDYCQWAGGELPTEAQWQKAARGTDGRIYIYPWGNERPDSRLANYDGNIGDTSPVTDYEAGASPYGALNMAGNVREWVNDWYGSNYYSTSPTRNPSGPSSGEYRVLRGGSWNDSNRIIRAAYRNNNYPTDANGYNGFRCVLPQP